MNSKKTAKADAAECEDKCCAGHLEPEDRLHAMRHSAAHVLAQAVMEMFPEAKQRQNNMQ